MAPNLFYSLAFAGCLIPGLLIARAAMEKPAGDSFQDVISFVGQHSHLIILNDDHSGASIAIWPAMQGRVLTSSASGPEGRSFGWVNYDLIASGRVAKHFNAVGGEDRLWLGPEGGQFSIFFAHGVPFDLDHWYTPAAFDSEPFDVVEESKTAVSFRKVVQITNYSETRFHVQVDRKVRLLSSAETWRHLGMAPVAGVKFVGFESENKLTNLASTSWSKTSGLLSLWVLGQFQPASTATIILPIRSGPESELGIPVTTDYFGPIAADRIALTPNAVFFKADANYRGKLGLNQQRSKGVLGSYDPENHVLTIVQFDQPSAPADYVNSAWKMQKNPYKGDVANCYNDGPPAPGKPQLGRFYELESSSPARVLASHESVEHTQRTIHLVGTEQQLDPIARVLLGVRLTDVRSFNH
jgi:hypothetical protein